MSLTLLLSGVENNVLYFFVTTMWYSHIMDYDCLAWTTLVDIVLVVFLQYFTVYSNVSNGLHDFLCFSSLNSNCLAILRFDRLAICAKYTIICLSYYSITYERDVHRVVFWQPP